MQSALERHQTVFLYAGIAAFSMPVGVLVARAENGVSLALMGIAGLAGIIVLASVSTRVLFLGWLAVAPFLQASADATTLGRALTWALYLTPALLMLVFTVIRRAEDVQLSFVDWLPAGYALYVFGSIALTTSLLTTNMFGTGKAYFLTVGIAVVAYYFLVVGPGRELTATSILATLLIGAGIQGFLAIVEYFTGWNVWNDTGWQHILGGGRVVSTLANPALLGLFLGTGISIAVAVLAWRGPRSLRRLSWITLLVCVPGLLATLTRGPILATAIGVVLLLLLGRTRLVGVGVLAVAALVIALMLPSFQRTDLYRERVAEKSNVQFREVIRDWSIKLAAQKPIFGWGYDSFDRVKNASGFNAEGVPIRNVLEYTSHDTYLTILVEYGTVGFLLLLTPFAIIGFQAIARARAPGQEQWWVAACLSSILVIFISASTFDARFFSFALMLPFVLLAVLRRATDAAASTIV